MSQEVRQEIEVGIVNFVANICMSRQREREREREREERERERKTQ